MEMTGKTLPMAGPVEKPSRRKIDRVWLILLAALIVLAVLDTNQAVESIVFVLKAVVGLLPFFLVAVLFAGATKASGADKLIAKAFSGNPATTIALAALAGSLSPFCSCGVIPLIAAMLASGVPLAPVMAFCLSSPIMDPEMFLLTSGTLGFEFAAAKTLAAIGMGLMSGTAVHVLTKSGYLAGPLKINATGCGGVSSSNFDPKAKVAVKWRFWREPLRRSAFVGEVVTNGAYLGKWMIFAFFLESLMTAYIPADWISSVVGGDRVWAIFVAAVVGVPAYLNGYAAIPLVSGLMELGMSPGAALAFMTAGAVSSIPAAMAVFALVRKPVFVLYLALGLTGSVLAGLIYQWIILPG